MHDPDANPMKPVADRARNARPVIFVLGSFVVSCSARLPRFPRPGESLQADIVTIEPGGKGFNLAVQARRLGAGVDGLLAIGDDLGAGFAAPALAQADLPATMLLPIPGPTGAGVGFTDASGETCLAIAPGANLAVEAAHCRAASDRIGRSDLVLAQFETSDAAITTAFALARAVGVRTLLNPSPFREIQSLILTSTDILIVNEPEAAALAETLRCSSAPDELAAALAGHGVSMLVLTRGARGAVAVDRHGVHVQPAFRVDALDALGAGDAFAATLGVALARGRPIAEALRHAAAAGALTTLRDGVFKALPDGVEIERLLAET